MLPYSLVTENKPSLASSSSSGVSTTSSPTSMADSDGGGWSSSLLSVASRMLRGLWEKAELPRSSTSITSSTDAACAQEEPAAGSGFDVFVGFVVATFFSCGCGPNFFSLTGSSSLPSAASSMFRRLRGTAELPRSLSSITSSTEAARVQEGLAGIAFLDFVLEVSADFVVAAFSCGC